MNRYRRLSVALAVAGVLGVAAPAAASAATTTVTISGATASYPLVSLLAQKYVKLFPNKVQVQDRPGRRADRHQRRRRRSRHDRRRLARSAADRSRGPRLLPDREVRDLRGHEQSQHALQPHAGAGRLDLHRQDARLEPGPRRDRHRHDRPDQPHLGRGRADELPDAAARRQESLVAGLRTVLRGSAPPGGRKRPERDRLHLQLRRALGSVNSVSYNGVACNKTTVASGQYAGIARFYEVTKGKATGAASAFIGWIESSAAARKIISSQWVPITQ